MTAMWLDVLHEVVDEEIEEVKDFCFEIKQKSPGVLRSNIGGWQSDAYTSESLKQLNNESFTKIISCVNNRVIKLDKNYGVPNLQLSNFWININKKTNSNVFHWHPQCFLSAVFYLSKENSKILFKRNYGLELMWLTNNHSTCNTDLSYSEIFYKPQYKQLLVFPGYLEHGVEPNECNDPRISIAFNFNVLA